MTAIDLTTFAHEVTLLGATTIVGPSAAVSSTAVTGFSDVATATIVVKVERVDNNNGEALSVTVQQSDDGNSWTTAAGPYSFTREGTQTLAVDAPSDRLRVTYSAARGVREATIGSVTVRLGVVDAPGGLVTAPAVTLDAAQVLALNTAPPVLVAGTPDAILVPVLVLTHLHGGTGGYTLPGAVIATSGDPAGIGFGSWALPTLTTTIQQGPGFFSADPLVATFAGSEAPNNAAGGDIYLYATVDNPTLGDANLTVQVFYVAYSV